MDGEKHSKDLGEDKQITLTFRWEQTLNKTTLLQTKPSQEFLIHAHHTIYWAGARTKQCPLVGKNTVTDSLVAYRPIIKLPGRDKAIVIYYRRNKPV